MTRIDLMVRAILEYAGRGELTLGPAGLIQHRGDTIGDDGAQQVMALLDDGVLVEDGELIVPAVFPEVDLDAVLTRHGLAVTS